MARIASGVNACCYCHVPYAVINKRYSASFGRLLAENAERFAESFILFSLIPLLSLHILCSGFLFIVFYEQSDHIILKLYSF